MARGKAEELAEARKKQDSLWPCFSPSWSWASWHRCPDATYEAWKWRRRRRFSGMECSEVSRVQREPGHSSVRLLRANTHRKAALQQYPALSFVSGGHQGRLDPSQLRLQASLQLSFAQGVPHTQGRGEKQCGRLKVPLSPSIDPVSIQLTLSLVYSLPSTAQKLIPSGLKYDSSARAVAFSIPKQHTHRA